MRIETKAKLDYLKGTKSAIADALVEKGQTVSSTDTFRSYADKVRAIKSGGGGLEPGVYYKRLDFFRYDSNPQTYIWFNGELYCFSHPETYVFDIYKRDGSAWNKIISQIKLNPGYLRPVFLNGKMHIIGYKTHFVFDGTTITQLNDVPSTTTVDSSILYNGKLVIVDQTTFYEWEESTDTWKTLVTQANRYDDYWHLCVSNGELYALLGRDLFHYSNGTITNIAYLADRSYLYNHNGYMYMTDGKYNFFRYDPDTQTEKNLGDWIRFPIYYNCPSDTPTSNKILTVGKYGLWMDCVEVVIVEDES